MRLTRSKNGLTLKAYAGCTGVLLAFNVTDARRKGLLGFALERKKPGETAFKWMTGRLPLPGDPRPTGTPISTAEAPLQKFRWSDYAVWPGQPYSYRLHAVYGEWGHLRLVEGPTLTVTTASADTDAIHNIVFNRAAAASQAFADRFPRIETAIAGWKKQKTLKTKTVDDLEQVEPGVKDWLTRGILGEITGLIGEALDKKWALDIAIYEFEWHEIVAAVKAAVDRGVHVRLLYHAKSGDEQTKENEHNAGTLGPRAQARARTTTAIFHNKFIVLSRVQADPASPGGLARTPVAVLCGSTNFTENGIFRQANVVHTIRVAHPRGPAETADRYLAIFEQLWQQPDTPAKARAWITAQNALNAADPLFAGFSPRSDGSDLKGFVQRIAAARRDVVFATAFKLPKVITDALKGLPNDPILRLGVQNTADASITGFHRDRTANFVAAAFLKQGLDAWIDSRRKKELADEKRGTAASVWKAESTAGQRGNILIHTKAVVIDFTSDAPVVISGSHNLSNNASKSNDENYLIITGNTDIADCYGVELLRIYDHYRARYYANLLKEKKAPTTLDGTDGWTRLYFEPGALKCRDRLCFAGAVP